MGARGAGGRRDRVDLAVVGGGPAGLATAIGARLAGLSVRLYDRRQPPIDKPCGEGLMPDAVARLRELGVALDFGEGGPGEAGERDAEAGAPGALAPGAGNPGLGASGTGNPGARGSGATAGPGSASFPFRGIRYVDGDLVATGLFPGAGGLGVRRIVLHEALVRRAEQVGVELCWGVAVEGLEAAERSADAGSEDRELSEAPAGGAAGGISGGFAAVRAGGELVAARFIAGADGLHSRVRRWAGLEEVVTGKPSSARVGGDPDNSAPDGVVHARGGHGSGAWVGDSGAGDTRAAPAGLPPGARFGVRRHFACRPWSDFVEVYWGPACEAYVTPVAAQEVGVAMLWSGRKSGFDDLLPCWPDLATRLAGAPVTSRDRGAGPLRQDVVSVQRGNVALVGDAAGYLDAITGEGIAVALHQAAALVAAIQAGDLARYAAAHRRIVRLPNLMTALVLALERRPALRRRAIRALAVEPALFSRLLGIHARALPPRSLGLLGAARLLARLCLAEHEGRLSHRRRL
jgi:flavin-dependent dehydrogenase